MHDHPRKPRRPKFHKGPRVPQGAQPHQRPARPQFGPPKPLAAPPPAAPVKPAPATHWGEVANWYDELVGETGSEYHREVVLPGTMRLLGVNPGDRVLDIACGQGVLCRLLAAKGIQATGVDAAQDLIDLARKRNDSLEKVPNAAAAPEFFTADARNLSFLGEAKFAAAACVLAIQNMHPIGPVFASAARALRPMGRLVIIMMHPCFRGPKETSWGWDDQKKVQYRRVDRYLIPRKAPIVTNPGMSQQYTWSFHKPIEAYVKALRGAGLLVDAMEEWPGHKTSTSGPRAAAENTARKEIPMFLAIRAVKAGMQESEDAQGEEMGEGGGE